MINSLANILPINIVGVVSGTVASGTPTNIFSRAAIQNVVIINEDPLEVSLVGGGIITGSGTLQSAYDNDDGTITTTAGKPVIFSGDPSEEVFKVVGSGSISGDLSVDDTTFHVDSATNRIGIGTTTPNTLLHIKDSSANSVTRIECSSPNDAVLELLVKNSQQYSLRADGFINRLVLHTTVFDKIMSIHAGKGFVGFNTLTPLEQLHVVGNGIIAGDLSVTGSGIITDDLIVGDNTLLVNTDNGSVGIGTPSPNGRLHVKTSSGDARLRVSAAGPSDVILELEAEGSQRYSISADRTANLLTINSTFTENMMTLHPTTGKIGINTGVAEEQLHVVGSGIFTGGLEIQGNPVILSDLPTASGSLAAGELWVDEGSDFTLKVTPA